MIYNPGLVPIYHPHAYIHHDGNVSKCAGAIEINNRKKESLFFDRADVAYIKSYCTGETELVMNKRVFNESTHLVVVFLLTLVLAIVMTFLLVCFYAVVDKLVQIHSAACEWALRRMYKKRKQT